VQATDLETAVQGLLAPESQDDADEVTQEAPEPEEIEEDDALEDGEQIENPDEEAPDEGETSDDEDYAAEQDEGEKAPANKLYTVKIDGADKQVTLEDLTRSYSGQAYIQKGMQESADVRKQTEQMYSSLQAEQRKFVETVQSLQQNGMKTMPQKPSAALLNSDPIGYMQENARYDADMVEYTAQQSQIQDVTQRQSAMQQQAKQVYLQEQVQRLKTAIPEFANPETAAPLRDKLFKTGIESYHFTPGEMGEVTDSRAVSVLMDAMKWRELQSGKSAAKVTPKPQKTIKPTGRRKQPQSVARDKQLAKARKTGSIDDFVASMLAPDN
jgi:hypothetical protein